ncbi:hypothetical protein LEN26_005924 [Aphanomyces euteiches]|nr:hypothetical protein LEN26_005924 [Aphanomyces euteiches]
MELAQHLLGHIAPLAVFVVVAVWMGSLMTAYTVEADGTIIGRSMAGFSWSNKNDLVFNWHPTLMVFGFIFCSSQAILVFVSKPFEHYSNKLVHVACHSLSILSVAVSTIAIFRYHNEHGFSNLHSVHSWVGLTTLIVFALQYVFGFVVYFKPGAAILFRKASMPYHIGFGLGILALIAMTCVSGILEQLSFNASCDLTGTLNGQLVKSFMALDCVVGSVAALLIALLSIALVVVVWVSKHRVDDVAAPDAKEHLLKANA